MIIFGVQKADRQTVSTIQNNTQRKYLVENMSKVGLEASEEKLRKIFFET